MIRTLRIAPLLLLAGCASSATEPALQRLTGFYSSGFEESAFAPCGSDERWWVTADAGLDAQRRALGVGDYQPLYVELRGEVGGAGRFGHLGAYPREIAVREVLEVRPARQGDCE